MACGRREFPFQVKSLLSEMKGRHQAQFILPKFLNQQSPHLLWGKREAESHSPRLPHWEGVPGWTPQWAHRHGKQEGKQGWGARNFEGGVGDLQDAGGEAPLPSAWNLQETLTPRSWDWVRRLRPLLALRSPPPEASLPLRSLQSPQAPCFGFAPVLSSWNGGVPECSLSDCRDPQRSPRYTFQRALSSGIRWPSPGAQTCLSLLR